MGEAVIKNLLCSPDAQRQLLAQLRAREAERPSDVQLLWRIAQVYRALGEFDQALNYYRAVSQAAPGHDETRYLIALLSGEPTDTLLNTCGSLVPPFLRFENFLDDAGQQALWQATEELLPTLHDSVVEEYGEVGLSRNVRSSRSNDASPPIRAIFHQRVADLVKEHRIIERLAIPNLVSVQDLQISVIAYGDGDYFRPHRDAGGTASNRLRELTFVYHFFREPKRFSGGELCLFDAGLADGEIAQINNYTGFEPRHNSILFFPSHALHEVRCIHCSSADPLDGRFALAGWALRRDTSGD